MLLRWLFSRKVRQATYLCKQIRKLVNAQRDLLSAQAVEAVNGAVAQVNDAIRSGADPKGLAERVAGLEKSAGKWIKPHPHARVRENVEVLLVVFPLVVAIHTFFFKPFKIPTGSMQPTLYGITGEDLRDDPQARVPTGLAKFFDYWIHGCSYYHVVAKTDGILEAYEPPRMVIPFVYKQRFKIGGTWYSVWSSWDKLLERAGVLSLDSDGRLRSRHRYQAGEDILKMKVVAGDYLFVDRLTCNFRRPRRGEILVFETRGIRIPSTQEPAMPQDQFYIKRMVAMDGERVQLADDRHLVINGRRLDHNDPHFENVYSFDPKERPKPSAYSGHVNAAVARRYGYDEGRAAAIAPLFQDEKAVFKLRPNHYLVMGDNTLDSYDGRAWGDFSRTNVIGKCGFVYWPLTSRFGWAVR